VIRLHDTMARMKREFEPADPRRITMYVCGPTVYGRAHIGNARPAVVFDLLRRVLEHAYPGADVIYARNVTDIDDKIINSGKEEGVDTSVITERYERFYLEDMGALGVQPPTIAPHATQEIPAMVAMIEQLIELGHAYAAEGHVLFSVLSDPGLWRLVAARPGRDDCRRPGRSGALQARPGRLRAVEAERGGRSRLGQSVGAGAAGLAHRMLGYDPRASGRDDRYSRRRARPYLSAP
jgi:hypothetical protein